jgi:hypothetical protein
VVCERWRNSFQAFLDDMGQKPSGMTLDRKDNDGPYSPENCRWATPSEQLFNSSRARILTLDGVSLHLVEWAKRTGLNPATIVTRLDRSGWSVRQALTVPAKPRGRYSKI